MIDRVGIVGLGLMGGSLLRQLSTPGAAPTPAIGWDADAHTRVRAATAGFSVAASMEELAAVSQLLFVAVPPPQVGAVFSTVAGVLDPSAIVSDLTSVKQPVREMAATHDFCFIGGHPMAGTEGSGFTASTADLFTDAAWVLTLDEETDLGAWLTVAGLVTSLGCRVVPCTSLDHDRAVARVSHLPHLVAAALTMGAADDPLALALAAGSFRDATRVAATRPELTAAMCSGNAVALDTEIAAFVKRLREAQAALHDLEQLTAWFAAAAMTRGGWPAAADTRTELAIDQHLSEKLLAAGRAGGQVTMINTHHVVVRRPAP